jgi:hypothetical protein
VLRNAAGTEKVRIVWLVTSLQASFTITFPLSFTMALSSTASRRVAETLIPPGKVKGWITNSRSLALLGPPAAQVVQGIPEMEGPVGVVQTTAFGQPEALKPKLSQPPGAAVV